MKATDIKDTIEYITNCQYSSPLVLRACEELSIPKDQLCPKPLSFFQSNSSQKDMAEVYQKHYEARRKAKLIVIAKHLLEKSTSASNKDIPRSISSPSTNRMLSCSRNNSQDPKLENLKKNIIKRLKVEKNQQKIKLELEAKRKSFEEKILAKSSRNEHTTSPYRKRRFEEYDKKLENILKKKRKETEIRERTALSAVIIRKADAKEFSGSFKSPLKKDSREDSFILDTTIDRQLEEINARISKSAERARNAVLDKVQSGSVLFNNIQKVKLAKKELENKQEQKNLDKIAKIQKNLIESTQRKEKYLKNQQRRISHNNLTQEGRHSQEQSKLKKKQLEREKSIEDKAAHKEKSIKEIKESIERNTQRVLYKAQVRKKEQEFNLNRIQRQYEKDRMKLIEKAMLFDQQKSKKALDIIYIKTRLEAELREEI